MTFQRFFTTIVGITYVIRIKGTNHSDALEEFSCNGIILVNHVTILEEMDARSQITLRLLIDEV